VQVPATHAHHAAAPAAVADPTRRARCFYEKNEPVFRKGHRFVLFPETVVRELPATLFLIGVVLVGITLAVRAGRYGATSAAQKAIWLHGVALYIVLAIVKGGSAENIMETRSSTVKWLLFPAQVAITALVVYTARRMAISRAHR